VGGGTATALPQRPAGDALWVDATAAQLTGTQLGRLEAAGFGELFVDAARVKWAGDRAEIEPRPLATVPRRVRVMLVARGEWPATVADAGAAARSLVSPLEALRRRAEEAGLLVVGWHLDLTGPLGRSQADLVTALRRALAHDLLVAVTATRQALAEESIREVLEPADLVVAFLYGVREGEREAPEAWDLRHVEAGVRRLEALAEPYLVGVVTRGVALHLRGGAPVGEIAGTSLAEMAWNRSLRLQHGFSLSGVDRQVYEFAAQGATQLGGTRLRGGDLVRVVGTSSAHLQQLKRAVAAAAGESHLGELYYRLAHPGEVFSLGVDNLLYETAGQGEPPVPRPEVTVETLARAPGRLVVRVTLTNASGEASELGQVESNFVELRAVGGAFGDVVPGDFHRYDLLSPGPGGALARTIRDPQVLRLFAPLLAPQARLQSGPVALRVAGRELADLQVRATFLASYGAGAEMGPVSWTELAPQPTPSPTPPTSPAAPTIPTPRSR
jgi:hypothetical protein